MKETTKIVIDEMINEMKNNKRLIEFYKNLSKTLRDFNNLLMMSYFIDNNLDEKEFNNKLNKMIDISYQTITDIIKKDDNKYDIFEILLFILQSILDTNPDLKEMSEYIDKKLSEEGLI
ncbi:MAG: hypothetical protein QW745_07065 [Thermoplasmata archaeon]